MRCSRVILIVLLASSAVVALHVPLRVVYLWALRGGYQLAELVGVMKRSGPLGGQVMGFNFQREPGWVHWVVYTVAAAVVYGPLLGVIIVLLRRIRGSSRWTLCGRCGRRLLGLVQSRCPSCGGEF